MYRTRLRHNSILCNILRPIHRHHVLQSRFGKEWLLFALGIPSLNCGGSELSIENKWSRICGRTIRKCIVVIAHVSDQTLSKRPASCSLRQRGRDIIKPPIPKGRRGWRRESVPSISVVNDASILAQESPYRPHGISRVVLGDPQSEGDSSPLSFVVDVADDER
jgi:hypothetical protein